MVKKVKTEKKDPVAKTVIPKKSKAKKVAAGPSPKDIATQKGEPYVAIVSMELDPADINNGAFELDWNDKFIVSLIKAGYKVKKEDKDSDLVDRWFQSVCRNIALEVYEQSQADPDNRMRIVRTKDLGNGRTEVS